MEGLELKDSIKSNPSEIQFDKLPTVENPHSEYFGDLEASNPRKIFGFELANVQITKGCRHACTFCAAGASKTVETMPFQAIIKISEQLRRAEQQIKDEWILFCKELGRELGFDSSFMHDEKHRQSPGRSMTITGASRLIRDPLLKYFNNDFNKANNYLMSLINRFQVIRDYFESNTKISETLESIYEVVTDSNQTESMVEYKHLLTEFGFPTQISQLFPPITNYYDSDPLDYKDRDFLHNDGTPADFGDVAKILATVDRPIHITTAGWSRTDKIAQRAAEKLVALGPDFFSFPRISVNQFEIRARKDIDVYISDTINTIRTLLPLSPQVNTFGDAAFVSLMKQKLEMGLTAEEKNKIQIVNGRVISSFSGNNEDLKHKETDHDVMACMPGYHIWPNGNIAIQKKVLRDGVVKLDDTLGQGVERGTRPTFTGEKMW